MRTTIGKLESDLEFQNKNQQLLAKQIDTYTVDLKRSNDSLGESKRQLETLQFKYDSLTNQMLEKQQDLSTLKSACFGVFYGQCFSECKIIR